MKKGFTLIELLAIIILLGIVALIAYPIINTRFVEARQRAYDENVRSIERASRTYGTTHMLGYDETERTLSLDILRADGLLKEEDIIDPRTGDTMNGCIYYKWDIVNNMYTYRYDEDC